MRIMRSGTEPRLVLLLAVGSSLFVRPPTATRACDFAGLLGDGFGASHAQSLTVAFAVSDAIDAGVMDKSAFSSALSGRVGYARTVLRLGAFHRRLSATTAKVGAPGSISVLLGDSRLWSRLSPDARGYGIATHTAGLQAGDVVVVTHEAVLAALVCGKLSIPTALDRGLLVVDGESTAVDSVRSLLNESFGEKKQSQCKIWQAGNERRILKWNHLCEHV
jgi:hypothetical protein